MTYIFDHPPADASDDTGATYIARMRVPSRALERWEGYVRVCVCMYVCVDMYVFVCICIYMWCLRICVGLHYFH